MAFQSNKIPHFLPYFFTSFLLCFFLSSCRTLPPRNPTSSSSSLLVGSVWIERLIKDMPATKLYFIRIDKKANPAQKIISKSYLYESNWSSNGYFFVFDLEEGEYALVAVEYKVQNSNQWLNFLNSTIFLDKSTIEKTKTTVVPGKISFVGELLLSIHSDYERADEAQVHFANTLTPGDLEKTHLLGKWLASARLSDLKSIDKSGNSKAGLETQSQRIFGNTQWEFLLK